MSTSTIEWTDVTWNPVTGCDRTSPGCDHCYALTLAKRLQAMGNPRYRRDGDPQTSGPGFGVRMWSDKLGEPMRWRKPRRVFVNSMSDLFHPEITDFFIAEVCAVMALTPRHTFQVLTKRPQRMAGLLRSTEFKMMVGNAIDVRTGNASQAVRLSNPGWENVWWGTSIESDRYAFRADHLRATPAAVRFLSLEPLLGPLPSLDLTDIDWVIVGGESGPGARPMHPQWVRDIRDRCIRHGVPFFFKQWGAWKEIPAEVSGRIDVYLGRDGKGCNYPHAFDIGVAHMERVGKKEAGRELDGRTWDEFPT